MTICTVDTTPRRSIGLTGLALRLLEYLHERVLRVAARDELEKLSDRDLADVGIERYDIEKAVEAQTSKVGYRPL